VDFKTTEADASHGKRRRETEKNGIIEDEKRRGDAHTGRE
jgi:hypothetical protein